MHGPQHVLTVEQGDCVTVPTMVFDECEGSHFCSSHTYPLVVELKVANALVRRILIDTVSFVDIITWDYCRDSSIREGKSLPWCTPSYALANKR